MPFLYLPIWPCGYAYFRANPHYEDGAAGSSQEQRFSLDAMKMLRLDPDTRSDLAGQGVKLQLLSRFLLSHFW